MIFNCACLQKEQDGKVVDDGKQSSKIAIHVVHTEIIFPIKMEEKLRNGAYGRDTKYGLEGYQKTPPF